MRRKIFFNGEFTELNTTGIKFLSVAFIADNGNELYLKIKQDENEICDWVKDNVIPYLGDGEIFTEEQAKARIKKFLYDNYNDENPVVVADVNQFDWNGLCRLCGIWNMQTDEINDINKFFFYIPIDFSTVLYTRGIDMNIDREQLALSHGINVDEYRKHNALSDVRVLKKLWEAIVLWYI